VQRTGVLIAASLTVVVLAVPLTIVLVLEPSTSEAACGSSGSPTGPGPANVPGIPDRFLPIYEAAAQHFALGAIGWAYLAALNYAESSFGRDDGPGTGVSYGAAPSGAAGPMEIGTGGAASDAWDEYKGQIPANVPGGAQPPDVHNEVDAVYVAAAILHATGAPGDWAAALKSWNDYPPEWAQVDQLVSQYTQAGQGHAGEPPGTATSPAASAPSQGDCAAGPLTGPMSPGAESRILPDGLATIPQDAPAAVQRAIAAGNRIIHTFYSQERRAEMLAHVEDSYDCSGASDYILYQAGLSDPTVDVGDQVAGTGITIEGYGQPGGGHWITVFGSSAHEFIKIDNIVMDTAHYAPVQPSSVPDPYPPDDPTNGGPTSGPRWQPASIIPSQLNDGNAWVPRHPAGL
jgi:hypothetical protein